MKSRDGREVGLQRYGCEGSTQLVCLMSTTIRLYRPGVNTGRIRTQYTNSQYQTSTTNG